jgi:tetratricopeptide (TPR) repeat protein
MQNEENARGFAQNRLPWIITAITFAAYLITINHWINLRSLPVVSKVTGWDWSLPVQSPLLFALSYPFRWLPPGMQSIGLNCFNAICAALALGLLARSVSLLPHDRTHEQRLRERSEFSLLSNGLSWLPPVLAVTACAFQLTFWEHATAFTGEMLSVLLLAYVIQCLLEYRISHEERWLSKLALVYGLGVTNDWSFIGYFPLFIGALIWIKGIRFFDGRFLMRMFLLGLAGLLLYLLLPLIWVTKGNAELTFWEVLKANLVTQKMYLTFRGLRTPALLVGLVSVLPVVLMGIRWRSSSGETNAAGTALTNIAFRVLHLLFFAAWLYIVFDPAYSPRVLAVKTGLPFITFLTFYYLGALALGYYSGYLLLVFTDLPRKTWQRELPIMKLLNPVIRAAVVLAAIAVPVGLIYKNYGAIQASNGDILKGFVSRTMESLPSDSAYILSDDPYLLALVQASASSGTQRRDYVYVNTRALSIPNYHFQLRKHYGDRWPDIGKKEDVGVAVDQLSIQYLISGLASSNRVCYLHPSFGYFFEKMYPEIRGQTYPLHVFAPDEILPPPLSTEEIAKNQAFWSGVDAYLAKVEALEKVDSADAQMILQWCSRALNTWGVHLQRSEKIKEAGIDFARAVALNTNNLSARINLDFNEALQKGQRTSDPSQFKEQFRSWTSLLTEGGPTDHPVICEMLGDVFLNQSQYRQASLYYSRTAFYDPTNSHARISLAKALVTGNWIDRGREEIKKIRNDLPALSVTNRIELIALDAIADYNQGKFAEAEQKLQEAKNAYPDQPSVALSLSELYRAAGKLTNALTILDEQRRKYPDNLSLKIKEAELLLQNNQGEKANFLINEVLAASPKDTGALLYGAFVNIQEKKFDEGMKRLDRVLELDPENVQAYVYKGNIFIEKKDFESAREALDKALELQPANLTALRNRAILNLKSENLSAAKKDYELLQRVIPRSHVVYYGLGDIAYKKKDYAEAAKYYESYLKYAPAEGSKELQEEKKEVQNRLAEVKGLKS